MAAMNKATYEIIAQRIVAARRQRGWSQTELANQCGWSQTRISGYEQPARKISIDDAITLAGVLGIRPAQLIFGDDDGAEWMTQEQRRLLSLFDRLPAVEQARMLDIIEKRLHEIDEFVREFLQRSPLP